MLCFSYFREIDFLHLACILVLATMLASLARTGSKIT